MAADISWWSFSASYAFLVAVLLVMRLCRIHRTGFVALAGLRMTVQMGIAAYVLAFVIKGQSTLWTALAFVAMLAFTIYRILSLNRWMNRRFMWIAAGSIAAGSTAVLLFYLAAVVLQPFSAAQYTIPLAGMFLGNAMTGMNLGLKTFRESIAARQAEIRALTDFGGRPRDILLPFINQALETAMLPTINVMVGMGIVFLPGMMSGQIIAGISPERAILYQMSVSMGLAAAVALACFAALWLGSRTLYGKDQRLEMFGEK